MFISCGHQCPKISWCKLNHFLCSFWETCLILEESHVSRRARCHTCMWFITTVLYLSAPWDTARHLGKYALTTLSVATWTHSAMFESKSSSTCSHLFLRWECHAFLSHAFKRNTLALVQARQSQKKFPRNPEAQSSGTLIWVTLTACKFTLTCCFIRFQQTDPCYWSHPGKFLVWAQPHMGDT